MLKIWHFLFNMDESGAKSFMNLNIWQACRNSNASNASTEDLLLIMCRLDSIVSDADQRLAYSILDAARLIGISRSKMYLLIAANKIPARKLGGRTLILRSDLLNLISNAPYTTSTRTG